MAPGLDLERPGRVSTKTVRNWHFRSRELFKRLRRRRQTDMATKKLRRGFAAMDRERVQEIARKGGQAAHRKGTAHKWDEKEAIEAGRKGGFARQRLRQMREQQVRTEQGPISGERIETIS